MGLYGEITLVESPGKLRMYIMSRALHIFGRIGNDKALAILHKIFKLIHYSFTRFIFVGSRLLRSSIFPDAVIFWYGLYILHGLEKNVFVVFLIGVGFAFRLRFDRGGRARHRLLAGKVFQIAEGIMF